jgi:hypothetical protein
MLSTVSLYMHSHLGIEARQDILYHRGKTMKIIHDRLANIENVDKGSLMSTIVTILSFEVSTKYRTSGPRLTISQNLCGNYYTSKAHLDALRRLIATSGGIEQYSSNDSLPRAVAWGENHFATAHRTVPSFKYVPTSKPSQGFPEELQLETAKTCPYTLVKIPEYGHTIYHIFRRIHLLGIATSSRWNATRNIGIAMRVNISDMILEAEYDMLSLSAQLGKERKAKESEIDEELIAVCDALITGAQIFLFLSLRAMPVGARVMEIYLSRMMAAMRRDNLLDMWDRLASYDALLWALFMAVAAAMKRPESDAVMSYTREVVAVLEIEDRETLEVHLGNVAWADFFSSCSNEMARVLFRCRSRPWGQPAGMG